MAIALKAWFGSLDVFQRPTEYHVIVSKCFAFQQNSVTAVWRMKGENRCKEMRWEGIRQF